jgi:serine/threonine protein kinase
MSAPDDDFPYENLVGRFLLPTSRIDQNIPWYEISAPAPEPPPSTGFAIVDHLFPLGECPGFRDLYVLRKLETTPDSTPDFVLKITTDVKTADLFSFGCPEGDFNDEVTMNSLMLNCPCVALPVGFAYRNTCPTRSHRGIILNRYAADMWTAAYDGFFPEEKLAPAMRRITLALHSAHEHNILHTDLKPENFFVGNSDKPSETVLGDFGTAITIEQAGSLTFEQLEHLGTTAYRAPEVVCGLFINTASDIWSLGASIAAIVLRGPLIYEDTTNSMDDFREALTGALQDLRMRTSPELFDLLTRLLQVDAEHRLTAAQALQHPFFTEAAKREVEEAMDSVLEAESPDSL